MSQFLSPHKQVKYHWFKIQLEFNNLNQTKIKRGDEGEDGVHLQLKANKPKIVIKLCFNYKITQILLRN